jgi:RNA recognition motif-containing protein
MAVSRHVQPATAWIANVPPSWTERDLRRIFTEFGAITGIDLPSSARGVRRPYAFVHFSSQAECTAAIAGTNGRTVNGCTLVSPSAFSSGPGRRDRPHPRDRAMVLGHPRATKKRTGRSRAAAMVLGRCVNPGAETMTGGRRPMGEGSGDDTRTRAGTWTGGSPCNGGNAGNRRPSPPELTNTAKPQE